MPVIEMQGLTKCFAGVTAVDAVNLRCQRNGVGFGRAERGR